MKKALIIILAISILVGVMPIARAEESLPMAVDGKGYTVTMPEFMDIFEEVLSGEYDVQPKDYDYYVSRSENISSMYFVDHGGTNQIGVTGLITGRDEFPKDDEIVDNVTMMLMAGDKEDVAAFEVMARGIILLTNPDCKSWDEAAAIAEELLDADGEWQQYGPIEYYIELSGSNGSYMELFGAREVEGYVAPSTTVSSSNEEKSSDEAAGKKGTSSKEYNTLQQGSRGKEVVELQQRLIDLKYLNGGADGDYGKMTATAVLNFQYAAGLKTTGIADSDTQNALFAADAPEYNEANAFIPVSSLSSEEHSYVIFQGDTLSPIIKVKPDNATNKSLTYSSDSSCVSIDKNGKITGEKKGKAKIIVAAADGSGEETYFYVVCEPACPVTLEGLGTGTYQGNLLALTFKNECQETSVYDVYFDVTLKAYNGDTISSGSYHTQDIHLSAGSTYQLKATLSGVSYASKYIIRITGVKLSDGTTYDIPYESQDVTSWG